MATEKQTRVLLVEDSPTDARLMQESLSAAPHECFHVITEPTLALALKTLSRGDFDVILLDLGLPDSQGIDTLHAVREHASHLPIVVLTISDDEELGQMAVQEGAQRFFSKDVLALNESYARTFAHIIHYAVKHKQIEIALAQSERQYRELLQHVNAVVVWINPELRITFANDYALTLLGYTADEFLGKHVIGMLLPPTESDGRDLERMAEDILAHPEQYQHNRNEVLTKDGRRLWIEWTNTPQYDEDRVYTGVLSVGIDITEQMQAEAARKTSEEQFRTLFNDSTIAQVRYDADGRPVEANKAAHTFLGIKSIADLVHVTIFTSPRVSDQNKARLRAGSPVRYELSYDFSAIRESKYFPTTHSSVRYADIHTTPLFTEEGRIGGYLAQIVDITDSKHVAEERDSIARFPEENPDPVLRIASTGKILYTNAAAKALLLASDCRSGEAVPTAWTPSVNEARRRRKPLTEDIIAASRVFSMRFVPVQDESYVDVYGTDVTRRREAEDALRQSRAQVHSLNEELHWAVEELSVVNETLEHRVQERTTELTSTNEELQRTNEELRRQVRRRLAAEEEAGEYARQQEIINHVIKAGNEAQDLPSALASMLDNAVALMGFDGGAVYLLDSEREAAELQYASPASPEILQTIPRTSAHVAQIYRGEPEFVDDVSTDSPTYHPSAATTAHIPLTSKEAVIGHYVVLGTLPHHFSTTEKELLVALGQQAGTVIARMQAEEAVRAQAELLDLANDAVIVRTLDHHIMFWNKGAEALYGWTAEEARGKHAPALLQTAYPKSLDAAQRSVLENGQWTGEVEATKKTGEKRYIEQSWTLKRDNEGNAVAILNIARDVTDRHLATEELRRYSVRLEELVEERTAQLRDAERLVGIGETAAMIGHDLRNPLQGLQYIVDLQKLRFERVPPAKRSTADWEKEEELFDRIGEQIFYMDKIVADLQDYARPIAPEPEIVAVSALINDVVASLPHTDHVKIISEVSDITVMADPHLMHRVFANLVLNAIQAMPEGGVLTISASRVDDSVAIYVRDTGVGIPADMKDKLFLPLSTGKAKGTGLGLAVVKRVVDAHGGTITFKSEEARGTTFAVTLPSREA
ncbi:MAG: PAS domain S-box protein [Halobacteriota archaeon]